MLTKLAQMLGVTPEMAAEAMQSERAARASLSRRGLFAAGAALVAGTAFSFGHSPMTMHEFQEMARAAFPGRALKFETGWDIFRDAPIEDSMVVAAHIPRGDQRDTLTIDLRDCDTPYARERLKAALQRKAKLSGALFG